MKEYRKLAYELARKYGYKYTRDSRYLFLDSTDKLIITTYIRYIIEQER